MARAVPVDRGAERNAKVVIGGNTRVVPWASDRLTVHELVTGNPTQNRPRGPVIAAALATSFAALERLPMPGGVIEPDGTLVAVNAAAARMLARPTAEILGRKVWEFAPGFEHVWLERLAVVRAAGPQRYEIAIATPEGARMVEYFIAVCELDGRPYAVAFAIAVRPLV